MPDAMPESVAQRAATFGGYTLELHYLSDGRRVVERHSMERFAAAMAAGKVPVAEIKRAMAWVAGDA